VAEVPIATIYGTETSSINPVSETYRFIRLACRNLRRPIPRSTA